MTLMRDETLEAPAAVARCLAQRKEFDEIGAHLKKLDPRFIVVCARGSSAHAGTYLQVLLAKQLGLFAGAVMPSIASVYRRQQRMQGALFIAISQSGGSPDLVAATALARAGGALTLAIVNNPASPLAQECDLVLDIAAGEERSVAATKTVLGTLAAGFALVDAWEQGAGRAVLDALPQRLASAMSLDWSPLVETLAAVHSIFTVGRGPGLGIASEAALKLAETSGIAGLGFSVAELAHGPMALAGPHFPVLAFMQDDATRPYSEQLLATLAARGVPILAAGKALPVLPPLHPDADLLPQLACFYLAAEAAARRRGVDPDHPPSLQKVTRTM